MRDTGTWRMERQEILPRIEHRNLDLAKDTLSLISIGARILQRPCRNERQHATALDSMYTYVSMAFDIPHINSVSVMNVT